MRELTGTNQPCGLTFITLPVGLRPTCFPKSLCSSIFSGDHGERKTPVPIPNTAVKTLSGDGTAALAVGE